MIHVLDISPEELRTRTEALGGKGFAAKQIRQWIWGKRVYDFQAMTNLSLELRRRLAGEMTILTGQIEAEARSRDGVIKLLLAWPDDQQIETVLIPSEERQTVCVSTQVGCAMGCAFCASGLGGLKRNLTAGEIVEQVLQLQRLSRRRVTNVVFMGVGEPLANYDATVRAVRMLIHPDEGGLSARKITVSTVGLPEAIRRLANENLPITLAISLHAPDDALRAELMPAAAKYPIAEILSAAEEFFQSRNREVTLEYTLLADVNDSPAQAEALAKLAQRLRCNVNLIRYNPVAPLPFARCDEARTEAFAQRLRRRGVNVNVRRSRGTDVDAACGQLRLRQTQEKENRISSPQRAQRTQR
ncbi:MAG: 23S rRNA (adenine(2503)-C(2))-methyltransferase RlmN [Phycisphaerae bacterium]|nr:23S rRNA (adenine(2503)-C(2))-methyltransferase RlmN [Phycisphaerae bacterium]